MSTCVHSSILKKYMYIFLRDNIVSLVGYCVKRPSPWVGVQGCSYILYYLTSPSTLCSWTLKFWWLASWKWLEVRCLLIEIPQKPRPSHHVRPKIFPSAVPACRVVLARNWTMTTWVLSYFRFDPSEYLLSLPLCVTIHRIVCLPEWYII